MKLIWINSLRRGKILITKEQIWDQMQVFTRLVILLVAVMKLTSAFQLPRNFYPQKQLLSFHVSFSENKIYGNTSIFLAKVNETAEDSITFNSLDQTVSLEQVSTLFHSSFLATCWQTMSAWNFQTKFSNRGEVFDNFTKIFE